MFLAEFNITEWILPISLGILVGALIAFKRNSGSVKLIYLNPEEFRANMRKGQLIDIRDKEAYEKEKINGSRNFPKRELLGNLFKIRADQPVFLYGDTDKGKVKAVGKKLMKKGYRPVYVLKDGFLNWPFVKK